MMKLKLLAVAAGLIALPAMGHAQDMSKDSMKMKGDTMMKHGDSMMMTHADSMKMSSKMRMSSKRMSARKRAMAKGEANESAKTERNENAAASGSSMSNGSMSNGSMSNGSMAKGSGMLPEQSVNGPRPVPPSDGTTCPWKCPTSKGMAGLTGPQFLALQQELRDKGCGTSHVTGSLDAPTRHAISVCSKRLGVANSAGAVLVAMNIGYGASDVSMGKM